MRTKLTRRHLLAGLGAAGAIALPSLLSPRRARSAPEDAPPPRFLIVVTGFGGASIIDSFMPIRESEAGTDAPNVNCFPDASVFQKPSWGNGTLRAVNVTENQLGDTFTTDLEGFVDRHAADMLVATLTGTSVNHTVAQKRALTGNGAWSGRTLPEAVAMAYGESFPLANVNMASNGYAQRGDDESVEEYAVAEPVGIPSLWPFALHGHKGVKIDDGGALVDAPAPEMIELARKLRNEELDPESSFYATFRQSQKLERYERQRNVVQPTLEAANLIEKLMLQGELPLGQYGLAESPALAEVQAAFPRLDHDPLHAQAALAYLLITQGVSVAVTLGTNFNVTLGDPSLGEPLLLNPPLSFDNSHTDHRATQAFMWQRMLDVVDGLIGLLAGTQYEDSGESYWDRSMIYCATDFGPSKGRSGTLFGTGHDLNNGVLAISPLLNGGRVLGGVDPHTGLTFGFDPQTGAPAPLVEMTEAQIYGGLVHALGVDTSGAVPDMPIMRA
jgi:hypothetical protein